MAVKPEVKSVRLRHVGSGAIVSVAAEKVARMGTEWEPVKAPVVKKSATSDRK